MTESGMKKKWTDEGSPIVSLDQLVAFGLDLYDDRREGKENVLEWMKELDRENPEVSSYINLAASQYPDQAHLIMSYVAGLYELLKKQAEANNLVMDIIGK